MPSHHTGTRPAAEGKRGGKKDPRDAGRPLPLPALAMGTLVAGTFVALALGERRHPLRRPVEPPWRRDLRNLGVAAAAAIAVQAAQTPLVQPLSAWVERRRFGLLPRLHLPRWLETALAVALMDYTLYLWHVGTHKVPFLWRFHMVHHVDLDLSTTTALRFHFGEMLLSVPWRAAQVALIGVGPRALSLWQTLLMVSIMFHHSNLHLPRWLERRLVRFVVTPRMHGIHHSTVRAETDSNWSSGLTLWDRLHGTLRLDVPQEAVVIGVPAYRSPHEVTLGRLLALPFGPERPAWEPPPTAAAAAVRRPLPPRMDEGREVAS